AGATRSVHRAEFGAPCAPRLSPRGGRLRTRAAISGQSWRRDHRHPGRRRRWWWFLEEFVPELMKKLAIAVLALALGGANSMGYIKLPGSEAAPPEGPATDGAQGRGGRRGRGGGGGGGDFGGGFGGFRGGGGGNFGARQPMTVGLTKVVRTSISS